MAIGSEDFMSTQTGGEGQTIQSSIDVPTPDQFKANISLQAQENTIIQQPNELPIQASQNPITEEEAVSREVVIPQLTEDEKIQKDLGLLDVEVDIPDYVFQKQDIVTLDEPLDRPKIIEKQLPEYTPDGLLVSTPESLAKDQKSFSPMMNESMDMSEPDMPIETPKVTPDGLPVFDFTSDESSKLKKVQGEYSDLGLRIDDSGRVEVKKPSDNIYPKYKLPDTGVSYEKRPDGWYKDDGKGNYIKLKTDVERRSAYLDKNAVPVSEFGTGTKNTQNASKIINERVGPLRSSNTDNVLTSGGDPTISDGLSFNQLTRSNIGKSSEKYNQDGTLNFNYDSKYENVPREVRPLLEYSGKPDGIYVYPGNDASYKKENGNWYKKPKGSSEYIQLKGEGVDQRISNLEMKAVASFKVKDASALINNKALLGSTKNLTQEYDNLNKVLFSGDGGKIGRYEESFEDAKNFANKDINLLLKDDMTLEQRQGLMDYQKRLNDIVSDGEYSLDKAIKTSQILKEAEQFFAASKDINKSINEAAQAGVSMARMSFENKKKTFQNTFLSGIAVEEITGSEFQKDAFDMFVATGSMADFFIENTDNGKIRFDSKSGQYVISKDISEIERKYIDEKLGQFVNQYNELQNKKFAETNEKVSKYKRSLSNINSNISKIEESLQGMRNAGMKVDDPAYVALSSQLDKERKKAEYLTGTINEAEKVKSAAFLTEPKNTAKDAASNLSQDAKNIFKAIPASIPPKQRFDLFYENLQKETTKFKKDNGIDESRLSGMNMAFKDLLDWDGFYALTEAEKRYAQNVATLRQLAPLYYNNDFGITQESAGFWESFVNSFYQSLFPNIAKAKGFDVQTSAAGKIIEVAAEEGYSEEDFIDSDALDKLRDRAVVDFNTMEKWGGMLGTTAGIIVPLMATRKLPSTALRVASNVERVIIGAKATADASKTVGIIANAEKVYDAVLSSNKIGRFLRPAIESGVRFEVAGTVFNQEELNFLSGLAGGVASEALSGVLSKIPKEQVYGYLSSVFGSQTSRAVNVIKATADASARGIAETGEEFAQEMTNIYKETDSFKGMMTELSNRFGTFDQVQEFVISSFILGAAFGVVDGKQGKDVLAKMPEEKRNQVNQALAEVNSSLLQADNAVDEYVENKLTQEAINKSVEEYDKKDEQGVSGQVGEGEKPVEGQPDVEAGQEAPSPSGMVQEEQTGVEPVEERVTATTAEEAKALWDQGYRPSVEGVETRGGKDMAIDNIFNTRKEVDMVRMVTPEATTQVETIDVYHGGSMDEKTGDIYVTEDKGQATEYAKGNDGNVIKYSIPKDKVASEEEVANTISELGIDTNEEAKLFELIDPRFEETYIGDENKQKLFDSLKDKGFEAASFIDEDLTLREKGGVRNIVVFEAERLSPSSVTVTENQAENLYDQGYRPVIDGETQADYNKENIGDLFEQSERIEMALPTQAETQAEAETEQKGFEKLAEKVREFKLKPGDLTGGDSGIVMSSLGAKGFEKAWNTAVEAIAQTIVASGNSAEAIQKAIDAGFKAIKQSDWYKSLTTEQKKQAAADYNEGVNKMFPKEKLSKEQREGMAKNDEGKYKPKIEIYGMDFTEVFNKSGISFEYIEDIINRKVPDWLGGDNKKISEVRKALTSDIDYMIRLWEGEKEKRQLKLITSDADFEYLVNRIDKVDKRLDDLKNVKSFINDNVFRLSDVNITTEQKGFEKLAEKIRSGKIDTRGGTMISIVPPQVLNAALEGVALTVETVGQIIEKIKESDWYKSLSNYSKPIIEREITRSLNNLASKPVYTQQDAENEAYITEFSDVYNRLLAEVEDNPNAANVNNLKAFTDNPKQFVQDLIDTGEIKSRAYENINTRATEAGKSVESYMADRMANVDSSISSDSKSNANNIIGKQYDKNRESDAPFMMSESLKITSDPEKAKADGYTDEEIKEAEEYLADPIKYHQEVYDAYQDKNASYYDEDAAQRALRQLNYVKSVYERYGVDTGLTPEQSQQIDQEADNLPPAPKAKTSRAKMTPEEKQAREDERRAERERVKAEREAKKKADKEFGKKVAEVTGTAKPQKTVQRTASQALKDSIRDREKGWKMGQKNLQDIKEQVRDYAKENLPKDDYSKKEVEAIMNSITNAKTPKGLEKALDRVDAMVNKKAEAKRKRTIKDIQKKVSDKRTIFSKRGDKWVGKVSVDSQKEFFDFINSPALSNLDTKTQEELDAINDVIDGILSEGKADYSAVQRLEAKAKRQRAAKLIEGLAKGKQKELKGIDAVRDWLDKGNVVIINGEMFRKSDLKSLEFNQATAKRKRVALEKKLEKLKPTDYNAEFEIQSATQEMIELDLEIKNLEEQISEARDTERALSEAGVSPDATFVGYQQEVLSEQRSAQSAKKSKLRGLNPINAVNDIYSLLKSAYSGSSAVTKFIKENIERPIKKAYFEKMKGYQAKISEYYNNLEDIFGSKKKGLNYLSSLSSVNPTTSVLSSKEDLPVTNGHMVDWYNLIRTNENGDKRMESGNKDPKAIISYVESDPKLKAYADYLLNEYNGNLRLEYEPVYQSYTNTPFGDTTYYPSYAAGFEDSFVSEDDLMSDSPKFNMMNATARNLKQRTNYSGPFDTRLDAHAKFFDYVKTMEHAKHFMPIAKSANELFSKMNNAYLIDNMGVDNFADLKEHLGVILSDAPLKGGGGFSNALSGFRSFAVVATLGGKLASIPKQFSSFTHYWTAGIELGVNPIEIMFAVPKNREELEFAAFIITSPYVKERYTGDSIDLEVRALSDKALKSNTEDAWEALSKGFLWPVRFGDRTSVSTGGGQFALAVYRQAKIDGMSESEARDYAYEQFVTQSEATQQSTRSDFTSLIQRDPTFRTIAMYRTGQMANAKKVVNGVKTIYQAYNIEKSEGTDARAEAISDDEIVQSIVDIMYYSTVGSWMFNAIASGALYYLWASETDDDDRDRMLYNLAMEQVSSNLQGYGATGYIAEFFFNALRGDEWKNNVPVLRTIENLSSVPPSFISAMLREWPNMTTAQRKQWLIDNKMPFEIKGRGSDVELEKFMEAFGDYPAWYKMNDSEKEQIIKNIGGGNINTLIKNTGKFIEGEGDLIKVLMNYEDQYMQKEKELGKKDLLWELITGEPYVKKDKNEKIKTDLIFPEAIKKENLQESLVPKLD